MNLRLALQAQLSLGIITALGIGLILMDSLPSTPPPNLTPVSITPVQSATPLARNTLPPTMTPTTTVTPTPAPLVTLDNVWMITLKLNRTGKPTIVEAVTLPKGRISTYPAGDCSLQILDASGKVLYQLSFQPVFLVGEPPAPVEEMSMVLMIPGIQGQKTIKIQTPQGEATYAIP